MTKMTPYTAGIANSKYTHPIRRKRANLFFRIRKMKIKKTLFTNPRIKKNTSNILNITPANNALKTLSISNE